MHKSLTATSRALGIDYKTLKRVLRDNNIDYSTPRKVTLNYHRTDNNRSKFAQWLKEHPDAKLPANMKEISRITGLSYDTVRCYFRRRRDATQKLLESLPDLRTLPGLIIENELGHNIRTDDIKKYRYYWDRYNLKVKIMMELANGVFTEASVEDLVSFVRAVRKAHSSNK